MLQFSLEHLVYVASGGDKDSGGGHGGSPLVAAGEVTPGILLVTADAASDRVVTVSSTVRAGKYAPHILYGDLVAAGFPTSSCTTAVHPAVAPALPAPARAAFVVGWDLFLRWLNEGASWAA